MSRKTLFWIAVTLLLAIAGIIQFVPPPPQAPAGPAQEQRAPPGNAGG